jgi:hypothetical protein
MRRPYLVAIAIARSCTSAVPASCGTSAAANWSISIDIATTPAGVVGALRNIDDKGRLMGKKLPAETGLKPGAGAKNSFRVTVKSNTVTVYANDRRLFAFKVVPKDAADAQVEVALVASSEKDQENAWQFSNVKLTEPPK